MDNAEFRSVSFMGSPHRASSCGVTPSPPYTEKTQAVAWLRLALTLSLGGSEDRRSLKELLEQGYPIQGIDGKFREKIGNIVDRILKNDDKISSDILALIKELET